MKRRSRSHFRMPLVLLFVVIFASWWGIAVLSSTSTAVTQAPQAEPVIVEHSRIGDIDTYRGTLLLPQCAALSTGVEAVGSSPRHITLILKSDSSACPTAPLSPISFTVSSQGPTEPLFEGVNVNGSLVVSMLEEQ